MTDTTVQQKQIPAYASFTSFRTFLDWLQGMDHIPEQIDRSLWGTKFNNATGSALMSSGRFLDLLVEERPTPRLHELARADEEARKGLIEQMIRSAYGDDIVERLPGMTPKLLDEKLRELGTTDGTLRKAASFFINALKATDVQVPPAIAKKARNRRTGPRKRSHGQKTTAERESVSTATESIGQAPSDSATKEPVAILRTIQLGEKVEAELTVRGNILQLENAADKMTWLNEVIRAFDKGEEGQEEEETKEDQES